MGLRRGVIAGVVLLALGAPAAAQDRGTERVVLEVEVLTFDTRPVIACVQLGIRGPDVRNASARVLRVVEGQWAAPTILLSWTVCAPHGVAPGQRYRIRVVRRTGRGDDSQRRFRVRHSQPLEPPPSR